MLGRSVALAAASLLLSAAASAQQAEPATEREAAQQAAPAAPTGPKPLAAEPDPLTPPEITGPPPAAPQAASTVAPPTAASSADLAVIEAIRQRLASGQHRGTGIDPADRSAVDTFYRGDAARIAWTDANGFTARALAALDEIRRADAWGLKASAFDLPALPPGAPTEASRAEAEVQVSLAILKYARHARGGRANPASISAMLDRKPQLFEPVSLIDAATRSSQPDAYLRDLHPRHAGFRNLQKALVAARQSTADPVAQAAEAETAPAAKGKQARRAAPPVTRNEMIQRIVANMERWRWMPDDLGAFHVWNNVPEQMTYTLKNGQVVFAERIIVGKPDTPTPNFTANMQFVIFQPEWGVPNGIKNNEIAPLLRRASAEGSSWFGGNGRTPSSVLARHGLRVSVGGRVVDPDSIDWTRTDVNRFNFIQPSGPTNVLGVVKFRFPNRHDVYMHDTPQRGLFSSSTRAFSHGCMRVQNPVRFAEVLLQHDKGLTPEQVRAMVPRGTNVTLSTQIPVHSVYFTAVADENGKVKTFGDLYGMDSRVASALEGRSIAVASRGEAAAGGEVGQASRGERKQTPRKEAAVQRRGDSNPFAGLFGN